MDKNRFGREVRPLLATIPIGTQGIAFDRLYLDIWADNCPRRRRGGSPRYSQAELTSLIEAAAEKVCDHESRNSPAVTWLRRKSRLAAEALTH
jgi:hypothetical protein